MKIELFPLEKIVIDDKEIYLNSTQAEVEAAIGKGEYCGNEAEGRYYYFDSELAISYNNGSVEFIEFLGGFSGKLRPVIYGVSVFDTKAETVEKILKEKNNGDFDTEVSWKDTENVYSYGFYEISVGIYRETIPEDFEEMIEENNNMSPEEIKYERKKAYTWGTIGIGVKDYYK